MGEASPKVSIVLPTYNGASKYIRQSIDSCLNQTYKNIELIIVDDGSTDGTFNIIKSYKDRRIRYIRHEKNKGLPQALNTGFAEATGDYLTWTSDDNEYLPEAIEEMVSCLNKYKDVDLVYADCWVYHLETGEKELTRLPDRLNLKEENRVGACFLYTRRVYQNIGNYNPKYELVEDYDYWIRIHKRFNSIHYPRPLYIFCIDHPKSLSNTKRHSVFLFDRILKYRNGYISLFELGRSFFYFFSNMIGSPKTEKEAAIICLRIYRLSLYLGLLYSLSLVCFPLLKILKPIMSSNRIDV